MTPVLLILTAISAGGMFWFWGRLREGRRADHIRRYRFPDGLLDRLGERHPGLSLKDRQLVARGLRLFFLAYLRGGRRFVSMPSQVVDDLWHEFILYTRHYDRFCDEAFGRFFHHTPAAVLGGNRQHNAGLRRVWWFSCLEENIAPLKPTRLPLLFALDAKLNIPNGFRYQLDCSGARREGDASSSGSHCAGDFSDSSYDGTTDGLGDGSDGGGSDGGCGGGCGGD